MCSRYCSSKYGFKKLSGFGEMIYHKTICIQTDDIIILITSLAAKLLQKVAAKICKARLLFLHYIPGRQKRKKQNRETVRHVRSNSGNQKNVILSKDKTLSPTQVCVVVFI